MGKAADLRLDEATHTYYVDGLPVPGVTRVIEPLADFDKVPREVLDRAAKRGTAVHLATQLDDEDDLDEDSLDPVLIPYLEAWRKFRREQDVQIEGVENRVYHQRHRYAGTYDRIGRILKQSDELAVIDIKAVAKLFPHIGVQTAAYQAALNSARKKADHVTRRYAVQLKPDGTYRLEEYSDEADLSVFLGLLQVHNWRQRHGK